MHSWIARLLALTLVMLAGSVRAEPPAVRTDAFGDPLPADVLARLGTKQFRSDHAPLNASVSRDGTRIALSFFRSEEGIRILDAVAGKELHRLIGLDHARLWDVMALSPDGKLLAASVSRLQPRIMLFDAARGKLIGELPHRNKEISGLAFSSDGKVLAGIGEGTEPTGDGGTSWDTAEGKERGRFAIPRQGILRVALSPDGKRVAGWSAMSPITLCDSSSGKDVREISLGSNISCMTATFSPDGKHLAVVESRDAVRVCDVASGETLFRSACREESFLIAYSPDGRALALADSEEVQLWKAPSGKSLGSPLRLPTRPSAMAFTANGPLTVGLSGHVCQVWDVKNEKSISPPGGHLWPVESIVFSPDGKEVFTAARDGICVWDARTGREVRRIDLQTNLPRREIDHDRDSGYHLSGDARRLLVGKRDSSRFAVLSAVTGQVLYEQGDGPRFTPETGRLVSMTGGVIATLSRGKNGSEVVLRALSDCREFRRLKTKHDQPQQVVLSPDARTVAAASRSSGKQETVLEWWDVGTGKATAAVVLHGSYDNFMNMAFSPDGTVLAASDIDPSNPTVVVRDAGTGSEVMRFACDPPSHARMVFAPDGRTLAVHSMPPRAGGGRDWCIRILELASRAVRHTIPVSSVLQSGMRFDFSPDGRILAVGEADTTVTLHDLVGRGAAAAPTAEQLDALWVGLDDADAAKAHRAMAGLTAVPAQSIPFLTKRLRPVAAKTDEKTLKRLIADLDSEEFAVRDAASRELATIGDTARSALETALRSDLSVEQRRRLQALLSRLTKIGPQSDMLRPTRALEVLERLNTAEARALVRSLSEGHADAPLTREAKQTLARMTRLTAP